MCMMNNQSVGEYNSPCGSCPEYLNRCMPREYTVFYRAYSNLLSHRDVSKKAHARM